MNDEKPQYQIRDVLFGDLPASDWPKGTAATDEQPWSSFCEARSQLNSGHQQEAIRIYQRILAMPRLESRHYLQAWHFLRDVDIEPDDATAKQLIGVVVEVALAEGLDIVAVYADFTARYINYSGAAVIWDSPDNSLDQDMDAVLQAGSEVVGQIGPWEGDRPPAPPTGHARISMLTPSGLHFGEAPFELLAKDKFGGPVILAAIRLMRALIAKKNQEHSD